jgi:hypothetical protein
MQKRHAYAVSSQKEGGSGVTPHPDLLKRYLMHEVIMNNCDYRVLRKYLNQSR